MMTHSCCVPGCSNRSDRETGLSYFKLPLNRKAILKQWIHVIRRTNLPINGSTRVCSIHFVNAAGNLLRPDEVPSLHLPVRSTGDKTATQKPPKDRPFVEPQPRHTSCSPEVEIPTSSSTESDATNVSVCSKCESSQREGPSIEELEHLLCEEKQKNTRLLEELASANSKLFRLENIKNNDSQVCYYTGFSSFFALKSFYDYLGPAVDHLSYSHDGPIADEQVKRCRSRALPPLEEFL